MKTDTEPETLEKIKKIESLKDEKVKELTAKYLTTFWQFIFNLKSSY